jgi:serine/threonine-protein kinase
MPGNFLQSAESTQQGLISGTPNYLAPEQARGAEHIDGRADIYALGCVAFWLLTGHRVFDQPTALAQIIAHASEPPARISHFVPVPDALEAIVQRCLAKLPEDRFPDARSLEAALAAVPFSQPWSPTDAKAFWDDQLPDYLDSNKTAV